MGVHRPTWVLFEIGGRLPARAPANVMGRVLGAESLESYAERLSILAQTDWLHGVVVRFGELNLDMAGADFLRARLAELAQHKRVVAFIPQINMTSLLAGSACEIVAPPSAEVNLSGFALEPMFWGAFLKRWGIDFENLRIGEYKAALTRFSEEGIDPFHREQLLSFLAATGEAWYAAISQNRGLHLESLRSLIASDPMSAVTLQAAGLIDKVAYEDELMGVATRPLEAVLDLLRPSKKPKAKGRVAVVSVTGTITMGKSRELGLPLLGGKTAGAETVIACLRRAREDKKTAAVVLYIDSGGGSALASDLIAREVAILGKPVVAVMGGVAASGGYYVAAGASQIVTSPFTLTGSIGVVAGKPVLERLYQNVGIRPEPLGDEAALKWSPSRSLTDVQRVSLEKHLGDVYERFLECVARGRGLSKERVDELGRGRLWSGLQAQQMGLVDQLGDIQHGVRLAAELAGLTAFDTWNVTPKRRGIFSQFMTEPPSLAGLSERLGSEILSSERALLYLDI